jgi:hypothetical protein
LLYCNDPAQRLRHNYDRIFVLSRAIRIAYLGKGLAFIAIGMAAAGLLMADNSDLFYECLILFCSRQELKVAVGVSPNLILQPKE